MTLNRYYAKITDEEILVLIKTGIILIRRLRCKNPTLYVKGRKVKAHTYRGRHKTSTRRWYWQISDGKSNDGRRRRRLISRAKLVWMFYNQQTVPEGLEVHHLNEDCLDDNCDNLEAWDEGTHRAYHQNA